jgi:dienelactone hydrolase
MDLTHEATEKGVTESRFELKVGDESVPGLLWAPENATGPRPLVLIGHGGTQHKRTPNVLSLARRFVRHLGYAAVAIDAPYHGERMPPEERQLSQEERWRRVRSMTPEQREKRLARNRPAVAEWKATLDAVHALDSVGGGPVGYWGVSMGTAIGLPFVSSEPRVGCAVLGLAGLRGDRPGAERFEAAARSLKIPVLFVLQSDDEVVDRDSGLALFDALGSEEKTMHLSPGPHVGIPLYERDDYEMFYSRHMGNHVGSGKAAA